MTPPLHHGDSTLDRAIRSANRVGVDSKAVKMFLYATLVNTPISHVLTRTLLGMNCV